MGLGPGSHTVRGKPNSPQQAKGNFLTLGDVLGLWRHVPFLLHTLSLQDK